jgi:hypothetical protein
MPFKELMLAGAVFGGSGALMPDGVPTVIAYGRPPNVTWQLEMANDVMFATAGQGPGELVVAVSVRVAPQV